MPGKDEKKQQFSEEEVIDMVKSADLSDQQVIKILASFRKKFGRHIMTPGIKEKLRHRKRLLG